MHVIDQVRRFIRQHDLIPPGARVVAALSGGSDSVALVHILRELQAAGEMELVAVAHLNHQLRATAARDERFSVSLAESLELPAFVERADVLGLAERERRSLEDAAHAVRYEFFERARLDARADVVALGHTRDDQAETFLLRLLRGAGLHGLAAMHPRNGAVVRPLLGCRRSALRAYLDERHVAYVEDESNQDVGIPRNRIRAELIPLLETRFNPAIVDVLADEAVLAREAWQWTKRAADDLYAAAVVAGGIDISTVRTAPPVIARMMLWRAMGEVAKGRTIAFAHVEAVLGLVAGDRDGALDLPGQRVQRLGSRLVLIGRAGDATGRPAAPAANLFRYPLSIPGEVRLDEAGCVVSVEPVGADEAGARSRAWGATAGNGEAVLVRRDLFRGPLGVRNRRPGDRFRPIGLGGRKKLQDFFVDRKVAQARRDGVPLVVDEADRIIWVAGFGIDEAFQVTDAAQGVLLLKLRKV